MLSERNWLYMERKKSYGIHVGISSILLIVVILALVCFAGLSLISASADYRLSQKLASRTTAYFDALSHANRDLAALNPAKIKESSTDSLIYTYPISDAQSLMVSVAPANEGDSFMINRVQVVTVNEPEQDNSLPVFRNN